MLLLNNRVSLTKDILLRYAHHLSLVAFFVGFLLDHLLLPRVDDRDTQIVIISWLVFAFMAIIISQIWEAREGGRFNTAALWLPEGVQFFLGAVFSSLFILYMRSASIGGSWLFLLLFFFAAFGNELFRSKLARLEFQIALSFFLIFSYMIYAVPLLSGKIGDVSFIISGIAALAIEGLFIIVLLYVAHTHMRTAWKKATIVSGVIFSIMNLLYFAHLIPPIPLVLRDAGVYHEIVRDGEGNYRATEESRSGMFFSITPPVIHRVIGEDLAVFSAVFAPVSLTTAITHVWEYKDPATGKWAARNTVIFPITGGRDEGYRGYSVKADPEAGEWRVIIRTTNGAELGRIRFTVADTINGPIVTQKIL